MLQARDVDVGVGDAFDLAGRRVPGLAAVREHERVGVAGDEVVDLRPLHRGAVEILVGAGEVLTDALVAVDVDLEPLVVGLRQILAVIGGHIGVPLGLIAHQILADEDGDSVAFLREAIDVVRTVRVDAVADGGGFLELDVELGVLGDDVVEADDPARLGQGAQPLAVGDDDVVLGGAGLQRGGGLLEERFEGRLFEGEVDVVAVRLLGEGLEQLVRHVHAEAARRPAGDTEDGHVDGLPGERVVLPGGGGRSLVARHKPGQGRGAESEGRAANQQLAAAQLAVSGRPDEGGMFPGEIVRCHALTPFVGRHRCWLARPAAAARRHHYLGSRFSGRSGCNQAHARLAAHFN